MTIDFKAFWDKDKSEAMTNTSLKLVSSMSNEEVIELATSMITENFVAHVESVILTSVIAMGCSPSLAVGSAYAWIFSLGMKYERERQETDKLEKMLGVNEK